MAIRFVTAVASRDRATIDSMLFDRAACERHADDLQMPSVDECADEMAQVNEESVAYYLTWVASDFAAGETSTTPVGSDPVADVLMIVVHPREGTAGQPVPVMLAKVHGHRYVMFASRKEETKP
jgi:hypothetical protein